MLNVIVKLCVKFFYKYNIENNSNKERKKNWSSQGPTLESI